MKADIAPEQFLEKLGSYNAIKQDSVKNTAMNLPVSKIGKVFIMKSGKVKMQIGDYWYDVSDLEKKKKNMKNLMIDVLKS